MVAGNPNDAGADVGAVGATVFATAGVGAGVGTAAGAFTATCGFAVTGGAISALATCGFGNSAEGVGTDLAATLADAPAPLPRRELDPELLLSETLDFVFAATLVSATDSGASTSRRTTLGTSSGVGLAVVVVEVDAD